MPDINSKETNIWFRCYKCGTAYDDHLEEIFDEVAWGYTHTSYKNKWDALKKSRIREKHEAKKREG